MKLSKLPRFVLAAAFTLIAASGFAQQPQLTIASAAEQPVTLDAVRIRTDIEGSFAMTSVEMRFRNPNRRVLEGELQFPLLDRQRVVGMAMDVDGKLRDAVPVEKTRGRAVFEEVTRAQIDPALLQVTKGNNYKLRVYPIPAGGYKTVVIRYAETLDVRAGHYRFVLPVGYGADLPAFELTITVTEKPGRIVQRPQALNALTFERSGKFYTARVARKRFTAQGLVEIALPAPERARTYVQTLEDRTYFYSEVPAAESSTPRRSARSVGIIWDSSGSGAQRDHGRELELLDAYFRHAANLDVRLIRIRERADATEEFQVRKGDWTALRRALESTIYDGATSFASFQPAAQGAGLDEYLLFSDGIENFGGALFPKTPAPVFAVLASARADPTTLRHIAESSGGRLVDLLSDTPAAAVKKLLSDPTRVVSLSASGASQLVAASPFPHNGIVRLAGVIDNMTDAEVRVDIRHNGAMRRLRTELKDAQTDSRHAAYIWANMRVAELEGEYALNRAEILRIGKAFGIATRETSLIVLDRIDDYARFEIEPPAELRAEYQRLLQAAQQRRTADRKTQLERVVKLFQEKEAWWSRTYPKDTPPPQEKVTATPSAAPAQSGRPPPPAAVPERALAQRSFARSAEAAAAQGPTATPQIGIELKRWTPDAPYIARFAKADAKDLYRIYLDERAAYQNSTAFFLDAADQFLEKGAADLGVRVLSNLAEMDLENRHVLRILGYRLLQAARAKLAIPVFEQVLTLAPEEPQSYRDLGLAYAADRQYQKAIDMLHEVVMRPWHNRFPEIELTALAEMNAIVAEAQRDGTKIDVSRIDARLLKNLPLDVRVVLTWDADDTDIDLWVTDPNREKAYYGHRLTYQGGRMSPDFTGGYGPEEFSLRSAKPGKYLVEVNFYGHRRQTVAGATTLQVKFVTGFGTPRQEEKLVTLRLRERKDIVAVGEFEVK
jgi:hypothetical protein